VCFEPSQEGIAALHQIANDPDHAPFVKALVYKDVAPKESDEDTLTGAGLNKIECGFHKQWEDEQRNNHRIPFWLRDLVPFPKFKNLKTLHYKPGLHAPSPVASKALMPLSQVLHVDPEAAAARNRDAEYIRYRGQLYQNRSAAGLYVSLTVRTKGAMGPFSKRGEWIEESMDGFYSLLKHLDKTRSAQPTTLPMRLVSRYFAGFSQSILSDLHLTTL
jgi:hypothetical protein